MAESNCVFKEHSKMIEGCKSSINGITGELKNQQVFAGELVKKEVTVKYDKLVKDRLDNSLQKLQEFMEKQHGNLRNLNGQFKHLSFKFECLENKNRIVKKKTE